MAVTETIYTDSRGWKYKVEGDRSCYRSFWYKPGYTKYPLIGNHNTGVVSQLPSRKTFADAQADLDAQAAKKGWQKIIEERDV